MKKKLITIIASLLVLIVALSVISGLDFVKDDNSYVEPEEPPKNNGGFIGNDKPRDLWEPDWETDILTLPRYLEKNRAIKYGIYTGSVEMSQIIPTRTACVTVGGAALGSMHDYFQAAIRGDHNAVNAMYDSDFFENESNTPKKPHDAFPMQKIYDIFVRKVELESLEGYTPPKDYGDEKDYGSVYYLVTYKIMENDGLFRYEIDADAEMVQLFEIRLYGNGISKIGMILDFPGFNVYT